MSPVPNPVFPFCDGPAFLRAYLSAFGVLLIAGFLLRYLIVTGRQNALPLVRPWDIYGLAYLRARLDGVLELALFRLVSMKLLDVEQGRFRVTTQGGTQHAVHLESIEKRFCKLRPTGASRKFGMHRVTPGRPIAKATRVNLPTTAGFPRRAKCANSR